MGLDRLADVDYDRERIAWWALTAGLGGVVLLAFHSFVGIVAFALFVYYGVRPLHRRFATRLPDGLAATATLVALVLPVLAVVGYAVFSAFHEVTANFESYVDLVAPYVDPATLTEPRRALAEFARDPGSRTLRGVLQTAAGYAAIVTRIGTHLFVALIAVFYLLKDDRRLAAWFREDLAGPGSASYAYATAVDDDLETLYAGYFLLIAIVAIVALVVYHGFNAAMPELAIPIPTALALATGVATLVPVVVTKIVYVPIVIYVGVRASAGGGLAAALVLLVICFVLLDVIPMMILLPRIAGRDLHVGLVLFSVIVGTLLFGWYGLFLGPFLVVALIQLARIGFSELVHGEPLTPAVTAAAGIGSDPAVDTDRDGADEE